MCRYERLGIGDKIGVVVYECVYSDIGVIHKFSEGYV